MRNIDIDDELTIPHAGFNGGTAASFAAAAWLPGGHTVSKITEVRVTVLTISPV